MSADLNQQLVNYIAGRMPTAFAGTQQNSTWQQVLQSAGGTAGEIRSGDDLQRVPRNVQLRAVYVPYDQYGPSIRWGDESQFRSSLMGGLNHDQFWRWGDNMGAARQGYIMIDSYGQLTVRGS